MSDEANPKDLIGTKKPRISLIPPTSLIYQALAMQDGGAKYGPYNFRDKKVSAMIYLDAIMRHTLQIIDGEWLTEDSKIPHLSGVLGSAGILADAFENGNVIDDRPKAGAATRLILEWTKK